MPRFLEINMLNVDMGLYIQFEVDQGDENGMGYGRSGYVLIYSCFLFVQNIDLP